MGDLKVDVLFENGEEMHRDIQCVLLSKHQRTYLKLFLPENTMEIPLKQHIKETKKPYILARKNGVSVTTESKTIVRKCTSFAAKIPKIQSTPFASPIKAVSIDLKAHQMETSDDDENVVVKGMEMGPSRTLFFDEMSDGVGNDLKSSNDMLDFKFEPILEDEEMVEIPTNINLRFSSPSKLPKTEVDVMMKSASKDMLMRIDGSDMGQDTSDLMMSTMFMAPGPARRSLSAQDELVKPATPIPPLTFDSDSSEEEKKKKKKHRKHQKKGKKAVDSSFVDLMQPGAAEEEQSGVFHEMFFNFDVPEKVVLGIFSNFSPFELLKCESVSKTWKKALQSPNLWASFTYTLGLDYSAEMNTSERIMFKEQLRRFYQSGLWMIKQLSTFPVATNFFETQHHPTPVSTPSKQRPPPKAITHKNIGPRCIITADSAALAPVRRMEQLWQSFSTPLGTRQLFGPCGPAIKKDKVFSKKKDNLRWLTLHNAMLVYYRSNDRDELPLGIIPLDMGFSLKTKRQSITITGLYSPLSMFRITELDSELAIVETSEDEITFSFESASDFNTWNICLSCAADLLRTMFPDEVHKPFNKVILFGKSIPDIMDEQRKMYQNPEPIPHFLFRMMEFLVDDNHLEEVGIFRECGSKETLVRLKCDIEHFLSIDYDSLDVKTCAGLLKQFFKDMPASNHLIPPEVNRWLTTLLANRNVQFDKLPDDVQQNVYHTMSDLHPDNYEMYKRLCLLFNKVVQHQDKNLMDAHNLIRSWGETLPICSDLLLLSIVHPECVFQDYKPI